MSPSPPDGDIFGMGMLWWSARNPPDDPKASFSGKTILITGANTGLGFESAVKFAGLDAARLIFGVRSLQRGEAAKAEVCRRTGYDANNIKLYELDLCSFESVRKCATVISEKEPRIDVAVLNAGGAHPVYTPTLDGYEFELQVMALSTALLAILLLPTLRSTAALSKKPSHLEFVGSAGHHGINPTDFDLSSDARILDQVNAKPYFEMQRQYCVTKLFVMYIMDGLIQDLRSAAAAKASTREESLSSDQDVIISTVCTGLCRTNLGREFGIVAKVFTHLYQLVMARSAEQGSRSIVSGTTLGPDAMGEFWSHDVFFRKGDLVTSEQGKELQRKVWEEIKDVLRQHVPDLDEYFAG